CRLEVCFFFQAEDGIRDWSVTGVQTCALPIYLVAEADTEKRCPARHPADHIHRDAGVGGLTGARGDHDGGGVEALDLVERHLIEIGRASCRERGGISGGGGAFRKDKWTYEDEE